MANSGVSLRRSLRGIPRKMALSVLLIFVAYIVISLIAAAVVMPILFGRKPLEQLNLEMPYTMLDSSQYPRESVSFSSGNNQLRGYLYGPDDSKGIVVIISGFGGGADTHLAEMEFFVDHGWSVFCFDGTGSRASEGIGVLGLSQIKYDLLAALDYLREAAPNKPFFLYGHSQGGYAAATVLNEAPDVCAAACVAAFDSPISTMYYHAKQYVGFLATLGYPMLYLYNELLFGRDGDESALETINAVNTPVLIIGGNEDDTVPDEISLYARRGELKNPNVETLLVRQPLRSHHSTVWRSEKSAQYFLEVRAQVEALRKKYGSTVPDDVLSDFRQTLDLDKLNIADSSLLETMQAFFLRSVA